MSYLTGDTPSYIDISKTQAPVLFVISQKKLPRKFIHTYTSEEIKKYDKSICVVHIEYGPAQDCPSGCIYKHFVGVVSLKGQFIHELPGPTHNHILSLLYSQPPFTKQKYDFEKSLENSISLELSKKDNQFGWKIIFTQPYLSSWVNIQKSTVTHTGVIHKGNKIYESFNGSIFAYLESGNIQWDFTNLQNIKEKEEDITIEEEI